jgi:hypothetical protein
VLDNKSNKVLACLHCNAEKGSMSPQEWFALPGIQRAFHERDEIFVEPDSKNNRIAVIAKECELNKVPICIGTRIKKRLPTLARGVKTLG